MTKLCEQTNGYSTRPYHGSISHLVENVFGLVQVVNTLCEELQFTQADSLTFVKRANTELDWVSEQSKQIRDAIQYFVARHPYHIPMLQIEETIEEVSHDIAEARNALRQAAVRAVVHSRGSQSNQIRSESMIYSLRLSLEQLQKHLKEIETEQIRN